MHKELLSTIDNTMSHLESKTTKGKYTIINDLIDCFISIKEAIQDDDLMYANMKLYSYFKNEELYAGNMCNDGQIYISKVDLLDGIIEYYITEACYYVVKSY